MAVEAGKSRNETMGAGRRFAIGANVTLSVLVAFALLIAINWIAAKKSVRRDLASFGGHGLSNRTKNILSEYDGDVGISLLYEPAGGDEKQQRYIDRTMDYCDELQRFAPRLKVTHIASGMQREKLVSRISAEFGGEADEHKKSLAAFDETRAALEVSLAEQIAKAQQLLDAETWLADFPLFAQVGLALGDMQEQTAKTAQEISDLTPAGGIPKYAEAASKAKEAVSEIGGDLDDIGKLLGQLTVLADETTKPGSLYPVMLRSVASKGKSAVESLRAIVGVDGDPPPADLAATLKAFADRGIEVGVILDDLRKQVRAFSQRFPLVAQHANWSTEVRTGPFTMKQEVASVLSSTSSSLRKIRLGLLGIIDTGDLGQLQGALEAARKNTSILERNVTVCSELLADLADRLANIDSGSMDFLEASRDGRLFAATSEALKAIEKQLGALPELKMGSVADQLKEDNAVIIEANKKIRVVSFESVWPVSDFAPPTASRADDGPPRTFNGDTAISSALLALTADAAFATVYLVSFEPPAPPRQNQFTPPPPQSSIPTRGLTEIRQRLEAANFKVVDWNLATQGEKPASEADAGELFVFLPPALPAQPSPFGGQPPPGPMFEEKHREIVRKLMAEDAHALFLTGWHVTRGFMGPPQTPPYGYGPLLLNDWGISVNTGTRIVYVQPEIEKNNAFSVVPQKFMHMPVTGFSDHAVGKPMRGTRLLISDACNIERKQELPDGVKVEEILTIPRRENYIGASVDEIIRIVSKLNSPGSDGVVEWDTSPRYGPFPVLLSATREREGKSQGRIVICGFGQSLLDPFLKQKVWSGGEKLRLDPAPTENIDLFLNAIYWLDGREEYIGRGPLPTARIPAIRKETTLMMNVFLIGVLPILSVGLGLLLWTVRRR